MTLAVTTESTKEQYFQVLPHVVQSISITKPTASTSTATRRQTHVHVSSGKRKSLSDVGKSKFFHNLWAGVGVWETAKRPQTAQSEARPNTPWAIINPDRFSLLTARGHQQHWPPASEPDTSLPGSSSGGGGGRAMVTAGGWLFPAQQEAKRPMAIYSIKLQINPL